MPGYPNVCSQSGSGTDLLACAMGSSKYAADSLLPLASMPLDLSCHRSFLECISDPNDNRWLVLFQERSVAHTHSVSKRPGSMELTLIFGPCVDAKHFIKCIPAALVTEYGILLPDWLMPCNPI